MIGAQREPRNLRLFVEGVDAVREVTMAKLSTQRAAFEVADTCLQIHGGAGYMKEILGKSFGL